jgi:hypothetical protein
MPEDAWSSLAVSQQWLLATGDFSGDRSAECAHVLGWVKGEDGCKAALCEHGRILAEEWLSRCPGLAEPEAVSQVKERKDKLTERAAEKATSCAEQLSAILHGGCRPDATCAVTGQSWATRCAKSEGSPLAVRLLERMIERKLTEPAPVKLDTRSCEALRAEVTLAARCKDRFACAEVLPRVEAYRARCERDDDRPTIAIAVAELAVLSGADKPVAPILVRPDAAQLTSDDVPVALEDGSGGVLLICEQRASDLERYLAARKGCRGGRMVVARAFKGAQGIEVRVGSLDFPDDAAFSARYPTIVASKEIDLRDREEAKIFEGELGLAVELARAPAGAVEAARALSRAVNAHATALKRSAPARIALSSRDEALAPALVELAKAKVAATRGQVSAPEVAGLLGRGLGRAFADVTADGTVQIGVASKAARIETAAVLPKAMARYAQALRQARPRKLDKDMVEVAKAQGKQAAVRCGAAEKRLQEAKLELINCSFELTRCDVAKMDTLVKNLDVALGIAEAAYHELDLARTGAAAEEGFALSRAADGAGCREPWW